MPLDRAREEMRRRNEPVVDNDGVVQAEAEFQYIAQDRVSGLGSQAPKGREPLDVANVDALNEVLDAAIESLTDGQIPPGDPMTEPDGGPTLPPGVYAKLVTLEQLVATSKLPELEPYTFSADELASTNAGLMEATAIVDSLGRDPKVKRALTAPMPGGKDNARSRGDAGRTGTERPAASAGDDSEQ